MRLAGHLHRTVDELLQGMTWKELKRWMELDTFSPVGWMRDDLRFALLQTQIANMMRDIRKHGAAKLDQFMHFQKLIEITRQKEEAADVATAVQAAIVDEVPIDRADRPKGGRIAMDTVGHLFALAHHAGHDVSQHLKAE